MMRKGENKMLFAILALAVVVVLLVTTPGWQSVFGIAPGSEGTMYAALILVAMVAIVAFVVKS